MLFCGSNGYINNIILRVDLWKFLFSLNVIKSYFNLDSSFLLLTGIPLWEYVTVYSPTDAYPVDPTLAYYG